MLSLQMAVYFLGEKIFVFWEFLKDLVVYTLKMEDCQDFPPGCMYCEC